MCFKTRAADTQIVNIIIMLNLLHKVLFSAQIDIHGFKSFSKGRAASHLYFLGWLGEVLKKEGWGFQGLVPRVQLSSTQCLCKGSQNGLDWG